MSSTPGMTSRTRIIPGDHELHEPNEATLDSVKSRVVFILFAGTFGDDCHIDGWLSLMITLSSKLLHSWMLPQ